jgi:hypothetical protein
MFFKYVLYFGQGLVVMCIAVTFVVEGTVQRTFNMVALVFLCIFSTDDQS